MVVLDTTKVLIFKQITTLDRFVTEKSRCFRYHKGTDFQANHNSLIPKVYHLSVVLDTTKVLIFKQITTTVPCLCSVPYVVLDTTKVLIFKQITTLIRRSVKVMTLF